MATKKRAPTTKRAPTKRAAPAADTAPHPEVAERLAVETDAGLRGVEVDETPNENYTVGGVTSGKPTPETTHVAGERLPIAVLEDGKIVKK